MFEAVSIFGPVAIAIFFWSRGVLRGGRGDLVAGMAILVSSMAAACWMTGSVPLMGAQLGASGLGCGGLGFSQKTETLVKKKTLIDIMAVCLVLAFMMSVVL